MWHFFFFSLALQNSSLKEVIFLRNKEVSFSLENKLVAKVLFLTFFYYLAWCYVTTFILAFYLHLVLGSKGVNGFKDCTISQRKAPKPEAKSEDDNDLFPRTMDLGKNISPTPQPKEGSQEKGVKV